MTPWLGTTPSFTYSVLQVQSRSGPWHSCLLVHAFCDVIRSCMVRRVTCLMKLCMWSVALRQAEIHTYRHTQNWKQRTLYRCFRRFFFNLSPRCGLIIVFLFRVKQTNKQTFDERKTWTLNKRSMMSRPVWSSIIKGNKTRTDNAELQQADPGTKVTG